MRLLIRFSIGALLLLVGLWASAPVVAQSPAAEVRISEIDTSNFPEIGLLVTVIDAPGDIVTDLEPDNLALQIDGKPVPVSAFEPIEPEQVSVYVVLALDISGSIDTDGLAQLQQSARQVIGSLTPDDQIALVFFGEHHRIVHEFTADHGAVINSINQVTPDALEGYTALYNGTLQSVRLASTAPDDAQRAVVVVTDGKNTVAEGGESVAIDTVVRASSDTDIPVYAIGVGPEIAPERLRLLSSDGRFHQVGDLNEIGPAFQQIIEQLNQQYWIRVQIDAETGNIGQELTLQTTVTDSGQTATVDVPTDNLLPERPFIRLSFTEPLTLTQPHDFNVDILWQNAPQQGQLLLNDEVVLEETLDSSSWSFTWVPTGTEILSGSHSLAIQVIDEDGNQEQSSAIPIQIVDPPLAPTVEDVAPVSLLLWVILGIIAILITIGAIFLFWHTSSNRHDMAYETGPTSGYAYAESTHMPLGTTQPVQPVMAPQPSAKPSAGIHTEQHPMAKNQDIRPTELAESPVRHDAMLLVEKGKASQSTLKLLPSREYDIGRDPQADLVLEGSRVSGTHARIRFMENGFTIVDMNSTNGLFVNGRREQHFRLQHNDRVAIGDAVLIFKQVDTQRS